MSRYSSALSRFSKSARSASKSGIGLKLKQWFELAVLCFIVVSCSICLIFRWLPPPTTMFMLHQHFKDLIQEGRYQPIKHRWVDAKDISPHAFHAVVASEDQLFFSHHGFDLASIQSSIEDYQDGGRLRGASTITQQVAKNLFLTPSKSLIRKGIEAWFTILLEVFWPKERILEVYLNIAEFGDHIFGIEAASKAHFGVNAKHLAASQAALLAATLPNPILLSADHPSAYVLRRQRWIMRQMRNLGEHEPA